MKHLAAPMEKLVAAWKKIRGSGSGIRNNVSEAEWQEFKNCVDDLARAAQAPQEEDERDLR